MAEPGKERRGGDEPEHREVFQRELADKARRKLRARSEGDRGMWFGLGMMGLVGWSVAVPTVLGIAVGVWLDARTEAGGDISWTLTGLVVGVSAPRAPRRRGWNRNLPLKQF